MRRAVADVVSVVAKHTVPLGEWPGLLDFLSQCSAAPEAAHREVALVLFAALTETIGAGLGLCSSRVGRHHRCGFRALQL